MLGCGLNIKYPPEHHELQSKIADNGAVISQFSFTTGPDKMRFPIRNRVISGLYTWHCCDRSGREKWRLDNGFFRTWIRTARYLRYLARQTLQKAKGQTT